LDGIVTPNSCQPQQTTTISIFVPINVTAQQAEIFKVIMEQPFLESMPTVTSVSPTQPFVNILPRSYDLVSTLVDYKLYSDIKLDSNGNMYTADYINNKIIKITPSGVVTTLAGSGTQGSIDGNGTAASFNNPQGLAVDSTGNVYVADTGNHRIRKITPAGLVTTLAGSTSGSIDGTGTAAKFNSPNGLAVDSNGNVYVADTNNSRIRKITPAGVVSILAGSTPGSTDATGTAAKFSYPNKVAVDSTGNVYVADTNNNRIRKITPAGLVTTLAGSTSGFADGNGTAAKFSYPNGLEVDSTGNVYVADTYNNRIRKITSNGEVSILAGSGSEVSTDGTGTAASFNRPNGLAVDSTGNVYVVDNNIVIRKINSASSEVSTLMTIVNYMNQPNGVAVDSTGNIYVVNSGDQKIYIITSGGSVSTFAGSTTGSTDGNGTAAKFNYPRGVAVDGLGNVYVADTGNHMIRKITPAGLVTTVAGSTSGFADGTGTAARFSGPQGLAVDSTGNIYVADTNNFKIRKITPDGVVSTLAGSTYGFADGIGINASFKHIFGVSVDSTGNVYVADTYNNMIRKITPDGVVSTFAGSTPGSTDATGTNAKFNSPNGLAVDSIGNVYVADSGNNKIRKITPDGVVSTLAGSGLRGSEDGIVTAASFNSPNGVALDSKGNIYVADINNKKIRKIT
jgi:sugar lactone lactonase YvrE